MTWLDRACNMLKIAESKNAPAEIVKLAEDAIQDFVYAQELRGHAGKRSKAVSAHAKGVRKFAKVKAWTEQ